jgi:hypothetical protein
MARASSSFFIRVSKFSILRLCSSKSRFSMRSNPALILERKAVTSSLTSLMSSLLAMLALHLLQISLVYINTLMVQQIFTDETWFERMTPEDFRALTPLTYAHINPYGTFELDMQQRLHLDVA